MSESSVRSRSSRTNGSVGERLTAFAESSWRASSSANIGLPPDARRSASRRGRGSCSPRRRASNAPSSVADSAPTSTRRTSSQSTSPKGSSARLPPVRIATSKRTGSEPIRRSANVSAATVGRSNHWTSSTTSTRFPDAASNRSSSSTARERACESTTAPDPPRTSAASIAYRCAPGSSARKSLLTVASRSARPTYGSSASPAAGRAANTRKPAAAARPRAARTIVVLPIPASPSSTSAAGPPSASPMNASTNARSSSLPMISNPILLTRS